MCEVYVHVDVHVNMHVQRGAARRASKRKQQARHARKESNQRKLSKHGHHSKCSKEIDATIARASQDYIHVQRGVLHTTSKHARAYEVLHRQEQVQEQRSIMHVQEQSRKQSKASNAS